MKSKRLLVTALVAVLVLGTGGYFVARKVMKRRFDSLRDQGIAASTAGDHDKAATLLARYLQRYPGDTRALRYYVDSRERSELRDGQHLADTLAALKILVVAEPDDLNFKRHLLELYVKLQRRPEAVDTANAVLKADPKDLRALRLKSEVLTGLAQYREALAAVDRWIELAPLDLKAHMSRLLLRRLLQNPGDVLVAEAEKLHGEHPDDPRFELLLGYAYELWSEDEGADSQVQAERQTQAARWLKAAAARPKPSDELIQTLVEQFDRLGMAGESIRTLEQVAGAGGSPEMRHILATRYWELGNWQQTAKGLADIDPNDPKADPTLLAFKAVALSNIDRRSDADACRAALGRRSREGVARAWSLLLRQVIDVVAVDEKQVIAECRSALTVDPTNAYLAYYLGDAQARLGDLDPAIQAWIFASQANLTWVVPPVRLVDALIQKGRPEEAIGVAAAARRRNPGNPAAEIALARAAAVGVDVGSTQVDPDRLYAFAANVQNQLPGEDTTLIIQVDLLVRQGKKAEAAKLIQGVLSRTPPAGESLLIRLALVGRRYELNVSGDCFAASEKAHGATPNLAYAKAIDALLDGKSDEGLAAFDAMMKRAAAPSDVKWTLARARYLDASESPAAKPAWVALGDANPGDLSVQQAAADARCVRGDWDFQQRTIDRLRFLTGEKALGWRLTKARLMIESPRKDSGDVEQAAVMLNDVIKEYYSIPEPHILLARALIQMKRVEGAIDQLSIAAKLEPFSVPVALQLAGLCQSKGDFDRARKEIERVMPQIRSPEQRHAAATLLARQGSDDDALRVLQKPTTSPSPREPDAGEDLLLANIYRQRHQNDKVDELLRKLLDKPDLATIEFASSFYASQSRPADAQRALAMLDGLKLEPGIKEMMWGRFCGGTGDLPGAISHYTAATTQAPKNGTAWRMLALSYGITGDLAKAISTMNDGLAADPSDPALAAAKSKLSLVSEVGTDEQLRPLALLILRDPENSDTAAELLGTLLESRQSDDVQRLASRLQQIVERHPDFLPARLSLVECLVSMNRLNDALSAAQRAANAFPNNPEPAALEARLCLASGRWSEAASAAEVWKKRSLDDSLAADLAIARAQIGLGHPDAALTQLQPYQQPAASDANKFAEVITVSCTALVRSGQVDRAQSVLLPLIEKSSEWRRRYVLVAGQVPDGRTAIRWIDQLADLVPRGASEDRALIAEFYDSMGTSTADARLTSIASAIYAQLASDPNAPPRVLLATGSRAERHGDPVLAEALYRKVVALDPSLWVAGNNLALLIVHRGGDIHEAERLATEAARLQPRQAAVRDTLADIQRKAGDLKAAAESEAIASRLDPDNVKWKVRLAEYAFESGNVAEAERTVQMIDSNSDGFGRLPREEQQSLASELDSLKTRLRGSKPL